MRRFLSLPETGHKKAAVLHIKFIGLQEARQGNDADLHVFIGKRQLPNGYGHDRRTLAGLDKQTGDRFTVVRVDRLPDIGFGVCFVRCGDAEVHIPKNRLQNKNHARPQFLTFFFRERLLLCLRFKFRKVWHFRKRAHADKMKAGRFAYLSSFVLILISAAVASCTFVVASSIAPI